MIDLSESHYGLVDTLMPGFLRDAEGSRSWEAILKAPHNRGSPNAPE